MPLYEYRCDGCGAVTECLVGVTHKQSVLVCAACGSTALTRIFSSSAIVSHGAGHDKPCADRCARQQGGKHPPCMSGGCCGL